MNTQRKLLITAVIVLAAGFFMQGLDPDVNIEDRDSAGDGLDRPTRGNVTHKGYSGPAIRSRTVSSAAQSDFEGGEPDDWDTLTSEQRISRTEDAIEALRARIANTVDIEAKQRLEEEALEVLSHARADYFLDSDTTSRYLELEASLGG